MESGVTQPQPDGDDKAIAKPTIWESYTVRIVALSVTGGIVAALAFFAATKLVSPGEKPAAVKKSVTVTPILKATSKPKSFPVIKLAGTIEPDGGVIAIAAPSGDSIAKVLVREGEFVRFGQPIVELGSYNKFKATLDYTKSYITTINRLKACGSTSSLPPVIPVSPPLKSTLVANKKSLVKDTVCLAPVPYEQMQQLLSEMPKLEATIASMAIQTESTIIRAPRLSRVLKVFPSSSDAAQNRLLLGDTRKMYAIAKVSLDNYRALKRGSSCKIFSPVIAKPVDGKVGGMGNIVTSEGVDISIAVNNPKVVADLSKLPVEITCN
jgi:multidrug efflux pump subunit AcrA (membrane-fusion protein)